MLDHSCQVGRAKLKERANDLYETPDVAVHALLSVNISPIVSGNLHVATGVSSMFYEPLVLPSTPVTLWSTGIPPIVIVSTF